MQWFELNNRFKVKIKTKCLQTSHLWVMTVIDWDKKAHNLPSRLVTFERDSNAKTINQNTCTSLIAPLILRSISLMNVEKALVMSRTLIFIQGLNKIAKSLSLAIFAAKSSAQGVTWLITDVGMNMISKLARTISTFHQLKDFFSIKSIQFVSVVLNITLALISSYHFLQTLQMHQLQLVVLSQ